MTEGSAISNSAVRDASTDILGTCNGCAIEVLGTSPAGSSSSEGTPPFGRETGVGVNWTLVVAVIVAAPSTMRAVPMAVGAALGVGATPPVV